MKWTPETISALRRHLDSGLSYEKTRLRMGCTRAAVAGAVRRYIQQIPDPRPVESRNRYNAMRQLADGRVPTRRGAPYKWTEEALTEPYAMRKLRKQIGKLSD